MTNSRCFRIDRTLNRFVTSTKCNPRKSCQRSQLARSRDHQIRSSTPPTEGDAEASRERTIKLIAEVSAS